DPVEWPAAALRRHRRKPIIPILGKAILDSDVLPLDKSGLVQALPECANQVLGAGRRRGAEKADHWHHRLLRPRRERPRRRAAETDDELAPLHVWMAPVWQEIIWRAAKRALAAMAPA